MLIRSIAVLLALLPAAGLQAQAPFSWRFTTAAPAFSTNCLSFDRLGPDHYRVVGGIQLADTTSWMYRTELDANGTITSTSLFRMDVDKVPYPTGILNTADGGQLLRSFWVDMATDKAAFVRTDAAGAVQWVRYYPDNFGIFLADGERNMVEKDGHYFVLGHRQDVPGTEGWANVLLELDSAGACVQLHTWAGGDAWSDIGRWLLPADANGLYSASVLRPWSSASTYPRLSIQKWNAAMQVSWSNHYSLGNYHFLNHALHLHDDGLLISGQVRFNSGLGPFQPFFLRLDSAGQVVWARVVLDAGMSPKTAVEEADGSFTVLGSNGDPQLIVARLDSAGALLSANRIEGLYTTAAPDGLELDSATGEHLIRARKFLGPNLNYLMRLDSLSGSTCGNQPIAWSDSLVAPQQYAYPATIITSTLLSMDTTWTTGAIAFDVLDACLATGVGSAGSEAPMRAWPVPAEAEVFIGPFNRIVGPTPYRVLDATGRTVHRGVAQTMNGGTLRVDVHALAPGWHLVVLEDEEKPVRVRVLK